MNARSGTLRIHVPVSKQEPARRPASGQLPPRAASLRGGPDSRYADGTYFWAIKEDASGTTMSEWRLDEEGRIGDEPTGRFDFHLASRPWFSTPRDAGKATWSEPYAWVGGVGSEGSTLGISYGIPLYDATNEFLGVVDADFSLHDFSRFLQSLQIGKTGVAVLTTRDDDLTFVIVKVK